MLVYRGRKYENLDAMSLSWPGDEESNNLSLSVLVAGKSAPCEFYIDRRDWIEGQIESVLEDLNGPHQYE